MRLRPGRRSCAQFAASSATKRARSGTGRYRVMSHSVAGSRRLGALKDTAREISRPSTSGSAMFMAMSRGERPRVPSRQAASAPPESTACTTGQS